MKAILQPAIVTQRPLQTFVVDEKYHVEHVLNRSSNSKIVASAGGLDLGARQRSQVFQLNAVHFAPSASQGFSIYATQN
jgi:hypothetical protein